jgi:peptidyl-tRNA hydrolase, PTH1 family
LFLLCGLGNKGSEYQFTRHNIGYLVVDRFSEKFRIPIKRKTSGCKVGTSESVLLAKPDTFMNVSGGPVASLMYKTGIKPEDLILVHDDLDMEFGRVRLKLNGGDGGHRGVRSVADALQTKLFYRVKIGIGRNPLMEPEEYVLSRFRKEEVEILSESIDRATEAIHTFIFEGKEKAMSMYNKKETL